MSLRFKLFTLPALAIAAAAAFVAWQSEQYARRQFAEADRQRSDTLVAQFNREVAQRGEEVVRAVQGVADSEATLRMAMELSQPKADPSLYANDARGIANTYHLDFLELTAADGSLISSAQWPAASGYHNDWVAAEPDWNHQDAFLSRVPLPDGVQLGLLAVRAVGVGDKNLYVIGGWRFDGEFLRRLAVPDGMRALLYSNLESTFVPAALTGPDGPAPQPEQFAPLVDLLARGRPSQAQTIQPADPAGIAETFVGVPLLGRGKDVLGVLLVGSSQRDLLAVGNYIRYLAVLAAGAGLLFSLALSWWASARVSHPVARLADTPRDVPSVKSNGSPGALTLRSRNEAGPLAGALYDTAGNLARERDQLLQKERVTARREMARRFTREIKESLFPLHLSAEDLLNAREETSERFDEIFFESMASLRVELERLRGVAARFGQFAAMPPPRPAPMYVNEAARAALDSVELQLHPAGRPPVRPEVQLGESNPIVVADPDLLRVALENILLDCVDAMPGGGTVAVRTREKDGVVRIEMSATGAAFPPQECSRLFTPGGSTVEGMRGLGLATAQAVVSDLGGRISAEPAPDRAMFRLEFPAAPAGLKPQPLPQVVAKRPLQLTAGTPPSQPPAAETEPARETIAAAETKTASQEVPAIASAASGKLAAPSDSLRSLRGLTFTG